MCEGCRTKDERIAALEGVVRDQDVMLRGLVAITSKLVQESTGVPATMILALPEEEHVQSG